MRIQRCVFSGILTNSATLGLRLDRLNALQLHWRGVGHRLAVHGQFGHLPGHVIVIRFGNDVGRRRLLAGGRPGGRLERCSSDLAKQSF